MRETDATKFYCITVSLIIMKRLSTLFITLILMLLWCTINAQDTMIPTWYKTVEPPIAQEGEAWSVCVGSDNFLYWSTSQPMVNAYKDQVLYKLDTDGNEIWTEPGIYRETQTEQSYVVEEHNGIVYTAGRICDCVNINLLCCDFSVVAWDSSTGDTLWSKRYDVHGEYEECDGIVIEDTVIFVSGWTREANEDWFDVLIMKLDMQGNIIWQQTWDEGLDKDERQDGHIVVDETHIFMTGVSQAVPNVVTALSGLDGQATIWKFDRNGNYVDHDTWGPEEPWLDGDDALGMTTDGTYLYAVGYIWTAGNNADWFIRKYDKNLNMIWEDVWGGFSGESGRSATVDDEGNIWCAVNTHSYADSSQNLALLQYSSSGTLDGFYMWGDTASQHTQDIRYHNGSLYCSGGTTSNATGNENPYLIRVDIDNLVSSGSILNYPKFDLNLFPNPCTTELNISMSGEFNEIPLMSVFSLDGKLVERFRVYGRKKTLNLTAYQLGVYLIQIELEERKFSKRFEVIK